MIIARPGKERRRGRLSAPERRKPLKTLNSFVRFTSETAWHGGCFPGHMHANVGHPCPCSTAHHYTIALRTQARSAGYGTEAIAILPGGKSRGSTQAIAMRYTPTCALPTARSQRSTPRARAGEAGQSPCPPGRTIGHLRRAGDACGMVAGYFIDTRNVAHGYLRGVRHTSLCSTYRTPALATARATFAGNMSMSGEVIAGQYVDGTGNESRLPARPPTAPSPAFDVPAAANRPWSGDDDCLGQCVNPAWARSRDITLTRQTVRFTVTCAILTVLSRPFRRSGRGTAPARGTYTWCHQPAGDTAGTSRIDNGRLSRLAAPADGKITLSTLRARALAPAKVPRSKDFNPSASHGILHGREPICLMVTFARG